MRWLSTALRSKSTEGGRTTFRWSLPLVQLIVSVLFLWPVRIELMWQIQEAIEAYRSGTGSSTLREFAPAREIEEELDQEGPSRNVRLCIPLAINLPVLSLPLLDGIVRDSEPWAPPGLDYTRLLGPDCSSERSSLMVDGWPKH